ncbi:MAG: 1-phosphofructokinase family hexose kinase [Propionibacteriaceae bacterium]|nr:1-phosphofructokinase family hexose kinase [Propionibacteriaceae bacterium]
MIVTFTPNPSLDRTARVRGEIARGGVHRLADITTQPGGKGVNIALAVHLARQPVLAVVPAAAQDPLLTALTDIGLPYRSVPVGFPVRTNLTLTEDDGTTTKFNEPGAPVTAEQVELLTDLVVDSAHAARWVALSGSLPPGAPVDWYARIVRALRPLPVRVAIDTSDAPLLALTAELPEAGPDLIKPNAEELAQLVGGSGPKLEAAAAAGELGPIVSAARDLTEHGIGAVLVTLGGAGALLVTDSGGWRAPAPSVPVQSTVGAGDAALTGYLLAESAGLRGPDLLRQAVAYGSAAAALPGTSVPAPHQTAPDDVEITAI